MSTETKTVRLDKEVMKTLADEREGFETPNDCLKRILNGHRTCKVDDEEDEEELEESEK